MLTDAFKAVGVCRHPLHLAHANQIGLCMLSSMYAMHGMLHWPKGCTRAETQVSVRSGSTQAGPGIVQMHGAMSSAV